MSLGNVKKKTQHVENTLCTSCLKNVYETNKGVRQLLWSDVGEGKRRVHYDIMLISN